MPGLPTNGFVVFNGAVASVIDYVKLVTSHVQPSSAIHIQGLDPKHVHEEANLIHAFHRFGRLLTVHQSV